MVMFSVAMRLTRAARRWLGRWLAVIAFAAFAPDAKADPASAKVAHPQPCAWSYSATLGFSNDNLLAPSVFAPKDRIDPGSAYFADDDGRTFGLVFEQVFTNERRGWQFLTSSWYEMLTQDGAQEDPQRNLRADMLNNIVQVNQRLDLGWGLQLTLGLGVGVQTVGDLNGIALQSWWHTDGGFGGRPLGWGLQDNYGDMQGSRTVPAISQGVRLGKLFGPKDKWHATLALDYSLLIALGGIGMSFGQTGLRGRAGHLQVVQVWAGIFTSGGTTNNGYLRFAPIAQGLLGYEIGLSLDMLRKLRVPVSTTVSIQSNGSGLADTTFTIGFILGPGSLAWIRPPR